MEKEIIKLIKLQAVEDKIKCLKDKLAKAPHLLKEIDDKIDSQKQKLSDKKSEIENLEKKCRVLESDIEENETKTRKKDAALMTIKSNREYKSILKEMDDLKEKLSDIETELIESLDELDAKKEEIEKFEKKFDEFLKNIEFEKINFLHKQKEDEKELKSHLEERKLRLTAIDKTVLKKYEHIKKTISAKAIVAVKEGICGGCNLNIPPQTYNELQKFETLEICPHCGRIIYYHDLNIA